jgi:ParB-like chromosome segregation protein Spo0J
MPDAGSKTEGAAVRPLHARRERIEPSFFAVAETDQLKVAAIAAYLREGGTVPPVVVVLYGNDAMPIDGHHRMAAHAELGLDVDAWTVTGRSFEALDRRVRPYGHRTEDHVTCGGVPALRVAESWKATEPAAACLPRS